jgi:hypothetical protein
VSTAGGQDLVISNVPAQVTFIETLTYFADWNGDGHPYALTGTYQDMESKNNQLVQLSQNTQQRIQNTYEDEQDEKATIGAATLGYAAQTTSFLSNLAVTLALDGVDPKTVVTDIERIGYATTKVIDFVTSFEQSSQNRDLGALGALVLQATEDAIKDTTNLPGVGSVADWLNKTSVFQQTVSLAETAVQNDQHDLNQLNHSYYSILGPAIIDIGAFISTHLETDPASASAAMTTQTPNIPPSSASLALLTQAVASFAAPSSTGTGSILSTALDEQQHSFLAVNAHHG